MAPHHPLPVRLFIKSISNGTVPEAEPVDPDQGGDTPGS
jgi:hypothetical protein